MADKHDTANLKVLHLDVGGMHCGNCAALVERRLKELPRVQSVSVDYPAGRAVVRHLGEIDFAGLQKLMADEGYTVSIAGGT